MSGEKSLARGEGCWLFATGSNGGDLDIFNIYRRRRQYFIPSLGLPQRPRQSGVCPSHSSGAPDSAEVCLSNDKGGEGPLGRLRLYATGSDGGDLEHFAIFSTAVAGVLLHCRSSPVSSFPAQSG